MRLLDSARPLIRTFCFSKDASVSQTQSGRFRLISVMIFTGMLCWSLS